MRDPNQYLLILIIFLSHTLYQIIILASSSTPPPQANIHHQCLDHQRSALALLLQNLKIMGDYSPDAEFWDLKTDCCSWRGVACNGDGFVTKLDFRPISGTLERPILEMVFQNLSFLEKLNLDHVDLSAQSSSWCEAISHLLPNLRVLSLSDCRLSGPICSSLSELRLLSALHLDRNPLSSTAPNFLVNSSDLLSLDLSDCDLAGSFPNSVFLLPKLRHIDMSGNSLLSGQLPEFPLNTSVRFLSLPWTNFYGKLPWSISNLKSLRYLNLYSCSFSGVIPSSLANLTHLESLVLPFNSFNGSIPSSLFTLPSLEILDLSNNKLRGQIPSWIWNITGLQFLDLSENSVDSFDQISLAAIPVTSVRILDLHANLLHGSFPKAICNFSQLVLLDLSYNNLSGQVPDCLKGFSNLSVLNLRRNNFTSMTGFPQAGSLQSLKIDGNKIQGKLPRSLVNCSTLEVLDLGDNMIRDAFPLWLVKLPALKILVLRANKFHGQIANLGLVNIMPMLHVMDLSSNEFTGRLSKEFVQSLAAMQVTSNNESEPKYVGDSYYYKESVTVMNKGLEMHMERILTMFTCLDLSQNRFHGEIPEEIRYLKSLIVLNLSHNSFIGKIPSVMRNLTELESLDLSNNKLSGVIPRQLTGLTFLEVINLSYNQLEGSIPQGNQFDTFPNTSYEGNPRLCGPPLAEKCGIGAVPTPPLELVDDEDSRTKNILDWKIVGMGYGSGLVIGFSIGYTIFSQMKIKWFADLERQARKHGRRFRQGQRRLQSGR